jgi:type IV secretion system protein VirB2
MQDSPYNKDGMIAAASWLEHLLLGSIATAIAVLAIATTGAMMLTGRVELRRGALVILGCFLLFGAPVIAAGLYSMLTGVTGTAAKAPPPPLRPASAPTSANPFDPYAGAAVPQQR